MPRTKIFGWAFILLMNEPFSAAFRFQSAGERNVGLTLRDSFPSFRLAKAGMARGVWAGTT